MKNASSQYLGAVVFHRASANSKLSRQGHEKYFHEASGRTFKRPKPRRPFVASTYVSIAATCPDSCAFKDGACYVQAGMTAPASRRLDEQAKELGLTGEDVIAAEAALINSVWMDGVPRDGPDGLGRPLRLHVGGDVYNAAGARLLAEAARGYMDRGGGPVWTYTHRWREIPRSAWGPIHVWASCEHTHEVQAALKRGYRASITVLRFNDERRHQVRGMDVIPCPEQTRGMTCVECRLCLDRSQRHDAVIAFAVHGRDSWKVRLPVLEEGPLKLEIPK